MDAESVSFTEREYDYAVETGKFVIAFVHSEPEAISVKNSDVKPDVVEALNAFRDKVKTGRLVREWKDRQQLEAAVIKSLSIAFSNYPQVGWIRGDSAANDQVLEQANKALQENAELRAQIAKFEPAQKPTFEGLAGLDDEFEFRYRTRHGASYGGKGSYTERSFTLSWERIFLHFAAQLGTAQTILALDSAVRKAMKEAGAQYEAHDINSLDIATMKAQFVALGLISATAGTSVKGSVHEYLSLTPQGHAIYMDAIVVRKN
jgi:hypothetical protein